MKANLFKTTTSKYGIPLNDEKFQPFITNVSGNILGYHKVGIISRTFFFWLDPIIKAGRNFLIEQNILPDIDKERTAEQNYQRLTSSWNDVLRRHGRSKHVLIKSIIKMYRVEFFVIFLLSVSTYLLDFSSPLLTNMIIKFVEKQDKTWEEATVLLIIVFILRFFFLLFTAHKVFYTDLRGNSLVSALSMKVYNKTLNIPLIRSREYDAGKLVNIMQVDLQSIFWICYHFADIASLPIQLVLSFFIMWYYVGFSFLVGVATICIFSLMHFCCIRKASKLRTDIMKKKDIRMKRTNEVLNGVKFVKMNALEEYSFEKIRLMREDELATMGRERFLTTMIIFITWLSPLMVTISTFSVYTALGNELTPIQAFTVLSTFMILGNVLSALPFTIMQLVKAFVALKRVEEFFLSEELDLSSIKNLEEKNSDLALSIKKGNFFWENQRKTLKGLPQPKSSKTQIPKTKPAEISLTSFHQQKASSESTTSDTETSLDTAEHLIEADTEKESFSCLQDIDVSIKKGLLVAVVGDVGSGKSSLFNSLLGEMVSSYTEKPETTINGDIAYVSQKSWIQNDTLLNNILFGKPYFKDKIEKVVSVSCLEPDLKLLKHGLETMIGEKGVNLSGGQRARVSLARALYAEKDIILLDDILSAVDAHVGKALFQVAIKEYLSTKTRILITHSLHYLDSVDHIYVLQRGRIIFSGNYQELESKNIYKSFLDKPEEEVSPVLEEGKPDIDTESENIGDFDHLKGDRSTAEKLEQLTITKKNSKNLKSNDENRELPVDNPEINATSLNEPIETNTQDDLILKEDREKGRVKLSVYTNYFRFSGGLWFIGVVFIVMLFWIVGRMATTFAIAAWCDNFNSENNSFYILFYTGLAVASTFFTALRGHLLFTQNVKSCRVLHEKIILRLLKAPVNEFFDRVPLGRILNRVSKDLDVVESSLPSNIGSVMVRIFVVLGEIFMCFYATGLWMILPLTIFCYIGYKLYRVYMLCNNELIRIEGISKSPIVSFYTETLNGLSVIRAFKEQERFQSKIASYLDENMKCKITLISFESWFGERISIISLILVITSCAFTLLLNTNSAVAGLVLSYIFNLQFDLKSLIWYYSIVESRFISFERCSALIDIPQEQGYKTEIVQIDQNPKKKTEQLIHTKFEPLMKQGVVEFQNVSVRYRANMDNVLKGVTFNISAGEKIGIVGRTGSGKSTMILTFLRILETNSGRIFIDGLDISQLDLRQLRKSITTIPQDPYLFEGTLRSNLDPNGEFTDTMIWNVLENVCLGKTITERGGLNCNIKEYGENLSAGEKQLLCLAQSILKRNKIILIDEATANIDYKTEQMIQECIKHYFKDSTVLTIAHRINTIINSDKIMVMNGGVIAEYDSPGRLLQNENSKFYALWKESANKLIK